MSQQQRVLRPLQSGRSLTPLIAMQHYGVMRLAAVVYRLRNSGYKIKTIMKKDARGIEYAEYRLVGGMF